MIMKIAVFLKNNELTMLHEAKAHVVIFNIDKDKVIGVENIVLEQQNIDSILIWLNRKSINQIYVSEIDSQIHRMINSHGIRVRTLRTLEDDKLYKTLALSSFKLQESY